MPGKRGGLTSAEWNKRDREQRGEEQTPHLNKAMGYYLRDSKKRLDLERYVTAFWGVQTSWARIFEYSKYAVTAEC